jgi:hypothetical protein
MNSLVKTETQVPATQGDPYAAYGATVGTDTPFLKFVKGQFKYGADDEVLPLGTRLVPNMGELKAGFIKWKDGTPEAEVMVRIADGKPIPQREDLGDDDRNAWETDSNGAPQDPWQVCNTLPMKDPATGQEFVFTTGSRGGIGAIGKLASGYGRARHKQADKLPMIEISSDSYRHKTYGDVSYPKFRIVDWQSEGALIAGESNGTGAAIDDEVPF